MTTRYPICPQCGNDHSFLIGSGEYTPPISMRPSRFDGASYNRTTQQPIPVGWMHVHCFRCGHNFQAKQPEPFKAEATIKVGHPEGFTLCDDRSGALLTNNKGVWYTASGEVFDEAKEAELIKKREEAVAAESEPSIDDLIAILDKDLSGVPQWEKLKEEIESLKLSAEYVFPED